MATATSPAINKAGSEVDASSEHATRAFASPLFLACAVKTECLIKSPDQPSLDCIDPEARHHGTKTAAERQPIASRKDCRNHATVTSEGNPRGSVANLHQWTFARHMPKRENSAAWLDQARSVVSQATL
ncbi:MULTISPECIES: hypothetical protein [unclassified Mesorhizobium]|uniref:hypothetical protein n=1 Tax=unclassified Mesorhizobium TaxID=325217 RepID=UPI001CCF69BA|nr:MULTISPECIES: hypothetical protein [unclassified Mesorhizobium]MBZ9741691.1 hypothetical protein [Mesorhizobium sp. CO1-1-4]MBZ9803783.1 hypothetical protein [Mesorhizobium sp. ES1-6]